MAAQRVTLRWAPGAWPRREIDATGDGVPDFVIDLCPWNLKSGKDTYEMFYDSVTKTVKTVIDFQDLEPHDWNTWVIGYPEVIIGRKPWDSRYVNGFRVNFRDCRSGATELELDEGETGLRGVLVDTYALLAAATGDLSPPKRFSVILGEGL